MKKDSIKFEVLTERPVVRNDIASELDIVIEVSSEQSTNEIINKKSLNLCIVIDRSGSMQGTKLETAKKSCIDIHKQLSEKDLFTVVVFDDEAEVIVNPQTPKTEVNERISKIRTGGQTNLSLGWYLGMLELQTCMTENHNNRLFLLSDGHANAGETKLTFLAQEASKSREIGITTSTIGIGDDFQEDILTAIATESGGRFWYIQESRIEDIIDDEFKGAISVVIDRPRVELKLPHGVKISKELNNLSKLSNKHRLRPIKGEDLYNFSIRLEINPSEIKDSFTIEAVLFDGEAEIVSSQNKILLKDYQEYVSSQTNPIVQSVVRQFESTITDEKVMEKMTGGELSLMKKMLIDNVGGMRKVRDALEEQREAEGESKRVFQEIKYLGRELFGKENELLTVEMLENFGETQEVQDFTRRWRKVIMAGHQRMVMRCNSMGEIDEDLQESLLEDALALAETLIQRFPEKAENLLGYQGKIREQLARYK